MQGAGTDNADVARIREALKEGKSFCGRLLNYKKDGSAFWNLLTITPIKDDDGKVLKFIGLVNLGLELVLSSLTAFCLVHPIDLILSVMFEEQNAS